VFSGSAAWPMTRFPMARPGDDVAKFVHRSAGGNGSVLRGCGWAAQGIDRSDARREQHAIDEDARLVANGSGV